LAREVRRMSDRMPFLRRFLRYLLPLGALVLGFLAISYRLSYSARLEELSQAEEKYVALLKESLTDDFQAVLTDLMVLVHSDSVQRSLTGKPDGQVNGEGGAGNGAGHRGLAEELRRFSQQKKVYDQIRILDAQGLEIVRVNFREGAAEVVDQRLLQSKRDRYYFRETARLQPGQVFVSPFDLNVEDGKIEQPYKPTIRFGSPVTDAQGQRKGILVLNYLGQRMLDRFARIDADSPGQAMLLNAAGYWLYAGEPAREWGFMIDDRRARRFDRAYPKPWSTVSGGERGRLESGGDLFFFEAVQPFLAASSGLSGPSGLAPAAVEDAPTSDPAEARSVQRETEVNEPVAADATRAGDPPPGAGPAGSDIRWLVVSRVSSTMLREYLAPTRRGFLALAVSLFSGALTVSAALAKLAVAREESEQALRESESRFRQMAAAIPEVFWLGDAQRRLSYVSPAFASIWGREAAQPEEAAQLWLQSIHPEDRDRAAVALRPAGEQDQFTSEYRIRRADGELRWIHDVGFAIRSRSGKVTGYAGIADDVTDLKESQRKVLQSARLAAIGEAITGLAHESRNALQRAQACLEMLSIRVAGQPEAAPLVQRIEAALRDLQHLYQHVRGYAAPLQLEPIVCDLRRVLRTTLEDLEATITTRDAEIVEVAETAGGDSAPLDCRAAIDPDAIRQVFRNILENALDPSLDGTSQRSRVRVEVLWSEQSEQGEKRSPQVQVAFLDNGPGFQEGTAERIFEPFFTTKTKGTGLGMAISRRIVEAHGGTISAASTPGKGLEVRITLPKVIS
jgi:PAS domain S-box-containing protein